MYKLLFIAFLTTTPRTKHNKPRGRGINFFFNDFMKKKCNDLFFFLIFNGESLWTSE